MKAEGNKDTMAKRDLNKWAEEGRKAVSKHRDLTKKEFNQLENKWREYAIVDAFYFGVKVGIEQAKAEKRKVKKFVFECGRKASMNDSKR